MDKKIEEELVENKKNFIRASKKKSELIDSLKEEFNLNYLSISDYNVTLENEFYSATYKDYGEDRLNVSSICKMDAKDISTFEEFQEAKTMVEEARESITEAGNWIGSRVMHIDDNEV